MTGRGRWGWTDEARAVVETYQPSTADVIQAVLRGTDGAVTTIAGLDTVSAFLEQRRRARRLERRKLRRANAQPRRGQS